MQRFLLYTTLLLSPVAAFAQSTFGTVLGTVRDNSGAIIPQAIVKLTNTDENTTRETTTNGNGDYEFLNVLPAHYSVAVTSSGFQTFNATGLLLVARQTLRIDATLQVGATSETINVQALEAGVITTDTQTIQETFDPQKLLNLPANVRANGNTSPYQLIQVLPGVQADDNSNFSIQGGIPSQTQYSLDGISITDVTGNQPLTNAFPSAESIAEIKVQGVGNTAEYGQVGDVTTVSKSGTNQFHGDGFWYSQNAALNALNYGQLVKNKLVANDFGASIGGPVMLPFYNGKDKTFFYGTYEGFRYPRTSTIQDDVPTQAMVNGNFSAEGVTILDPTSGQPFANDTIPASRINSVSKAFLALYPQPNAGVTNVFHSANYVANRSATYSDDQYDIRIDQYLSSKQSIFGRWTWKDITSLSPIDLLFPSSSNPDNYRLLVVSHTYTILPNLLNEARFGLTRNDRGSSSSFNGRQFTSGLGLQGLIGGPPFFFNGVPEVDINNLTGITADRLDGITKSYTYQAVDNITWIKGRHTMKFGFDYRHIEAVTPLGFFGADNYGTFNFSGQFTNAPFADFLLGIPSQSNIDNVQKDNDGLTSHYNAYAQDSFRLNSNLTLEYGLRFEFHPGYVDASGNIGNFDPRVPLSGAVVYPDGKQALLAPGFLQTFDACPTLGSTSGPSANGAPCTPVLSASQAHLPNSLRTAPKRFMPRFGFAYRPFGNNKTVVRGGFSMYNTEVLGSIYYALTGTLQAQTLTFNNSITNGVPAFQWPNVSAGTGNNGAGPLGSAYFGTANQIEYKDPYSEQWNLSIDRDLGNQTGLRVSYIGMVTHDLVWAPNLNQSYYSTTPFVDQPLSRQPFPNWGVINTRANGANANYNAFQLEVNHRYKAGVTFNSAYTFAKALADNQGYTATSFAGENAGGRTMDALDRRHEYGPVYGVRHNRWITSAIYELPVGHGRQFGGSMNRIADAVVGGWQLSSIFLWQSGPFLTPYFSGGDPSGTGSGAIGRAQAPDLAGNPNMSNPNRNDWFNLGAFVCPATPGWTPGTGCSIGSGAPGALPPIGRFGTAGMGTFTGPGTVNLNAGLAKYFNLTERWKVKVEASFTNSLNHVNLANPVLSITSSSEGRITSARPADFGGSRTGQVGARIEF